MPYFICFDISPPTGFGIWERLGRSSTAETAAEAEAEVRATMEAKYGPLGAPADVYKFEEN